MNEDQLLDIGRSVFPTVATAQQASTSRATASKCDLLNFVSMSNIAQAQEIQLLDGRLTVGNKKTPRKRLSQAQYFESALKMFSLFEAEGVGNDYRVYITRVAQLAQVFTWASVLLFDREFRKLQAEKTTPEWAQEFSYLMSLCLRPLNPAASGVKRPAQAKTDPASGKPVCIRFNRGLCTHSSCRYAHVCMQCCGKNSKLQHASVTQESKNW
jgi:hypothetical protein